MKMWMRVALGFGLTIAAPATAGVAARADQQQLAANASMTAGNLAAIFGRSVNGVRDTAADAAPAELEAAVSEALETDIIESGSTVLVVQEALGMTLAEQRCTLEDRQRGTWNRSGCAAIADLLETVTTALAGPAAAGPTGGIAGVAGGAPPVSAAGSDYAVD